MRLPPAIIASVVLAIGLGCGTEYAQSSIPLTDLTIRAELSRDATPPD